MICFCIALRNKKSTKNWENVIYDFNNTLESIFNQTNDEFEVFVGCNEIPKLFKKYDERLHFVITDTPLPKTWQEGCRDRSWKLLACAYEVRKNLSRLQVYGGGTFVFPVDADDYVNCNIAQYCVDHPNSNGFKSKYSYKWFKGNNYMYITKYFGGTMNIMKLFEDDLPEKLGNPLDAFDAEKARELTLRYPIRWYDIDVEKKFADIGRPLEYLPFKSTIYVLGTGENISNYDPNNIKISEDGIHLGILLYRINPFNKKRITKKLIKEFKLNIY